MDHHPLDLDTPLADVPRVLVVETEAGRALVRVLRTSDRREVEAHLPDGRLTKMQGVPAERSLRQVGAALTGSRPLRAFVLPRARIESHYRPWPTVVMATPFVAAVALLATAALGDALGWLRWVLMAVGLVILVVAADARRKAQRHREWLATPPGGEPVRAAELDLPPLEEEFAVDDVKEEYGRLLSDISYRIENPALFDTQEPLSKAFTLALLQWDNNDGVATTDERRALAAHVRATFAAARANAERLGMDHLPEASRDKARTALKTAALAADTAAPEPEREAALRRTIALLDELALYYLPTGTDARKAITGRGAPQLPGRRSG